jgi:hypothetical protein
MGNFKTLYLAGQIFKFGVAQTDKIPSALSVDWENVQTSTPLTNWDRGISSRFHILNI